MMDDNKVVIFPEATMTDTESFEIGYPLDEVMNSEYCRNNKTCIEKEIRVLANLPKMKNIKWTTEM